MSGFLSQTLGLLLVVHLASVPSTRPTDRPDRPPAGRVLLRYCADPAPLRWSTAVAPAGGNDPGAAGGGSADGLARPPGGIDRGGSRLEAPSIPGFLIRPPSHLRC